MSKPTKVSMSVIRRLPKYYRCLEEFLKNDIKRISSEELGEKIGITASQVRQDLHNFGTFGYQGYGYNVEELYRDLAKILGLHRKYSVIIVGAGNLGQAIANYIYFGKSSFVLKGIFDINPKLFSWKIRDIRIMDVETIEEFIFKNQIDIAVLCIPEESVKNMTNRLVKAGIKAIWNFSPVDLKVPNNVILENVYLTDSLFTISYRLNEEELFKKLRREK